jgi:hypothetical protein
MLDLMKTAPERGPSLSTGSKDVSCPWVLSPNNAMPKGFLRIIPEQPPDPLDKKSNVHDPGVGDAQTTLVLRLAHLLPAYPVLFTFFPGTFPEEPTPMLVEASMSPIG